MREGLQRVHCLTYDEDSGVMACNAGDGKVELWMWQSEDEAKLKRDKRLRKERKRMKKNLAVSGIEDQQESLYVYPFPIIDMWESRMSYTDLG